MNRISRETVQRILDAASIVDVVGDFVNLKRSGSGFKGLCPFHNERTPSFSVSPSKNVCKCFSCGKGGSPVNFIMELEQMSYGEALRYLARKYNIPVEEQELTDDERRQASRRESMFAINEFAHKHFKSRLTDTDEGRDIGLAYFRHRGMSDAMIERFGLGYALDKRDDVLKAALANGYDEEWLIATGLCSKSDRGEIYDRFRGRVIYPVYTVSGKVVAFGARTLRNDKKIAKYVNSPESDIYSKSRELYGLYQAKKAIIAEDKCILVEGYMDVISMHQVGVENVVASSGTSLTEGQIRLIRRFTPNVTVIYDSDAAGIKASLRGIDMLLSEGLNVKVLLLPDGDDPDTFAQARSGDEVRQFIKENETDFISFKSRILLEGAAGDPYKLSKAIGEIVHSIALIVNDITRTLYIKQCSLTFNVSESVLVSEVNKERRAIAKERGKSLRRDLPTTASADVEPESASDAGTQTVIIPTQSSAADTSHEAVADSESVRIRNSELELLQLILRYGMMYLSEYAESEPAGNTVLDFIRSEFEANDITLRNDDVRRVYDYVIEQVDAEWERDFEVFTAENERLRQQELEQGTQVIKQTADNLAEITRMTASLNEQVAASFVDRDKHFRQTYISKSALNHADDCVRHIANELVPERYRLSKIHTRYSAVPTEEDMLDKRVNNAVFLYEYLLIASRISVVKQQFNDCADDVERQRDILHQLQYLNEFKKQYAAMLGERVISPRD